MALQPINYILPEDDILNKVATGLKIGAGVQELSQKVIDRDRANTLAEDYKKDLTTAFTNPTPESFAMLSAKYPTQREAFKQSWDMLDSSQKKQELQTTGQVYSALNSNNPELAKSIITQNIQAMENSGKDATNLKNISSYIDNDPKGAAGYAGLVLSSIMDNKEFVSTFKGIGEEKRATELQPYKMEEEKGKAQKASVEGMYARSQAIADLDKKGWDVEKIKNDISNSQIDTKLKVLENQYKKTDNELKKQEIGLKMQAEQEKLDEAIRTRTSGAESSRATIDNMLNTTDRLLNTDRKVWKDATGPIASKVFTTSQDTADFEELINTLGSQAFLSQVSTMKGMGALSNAEGEKLQSGLQSLSLRQSPERLEKNLKEIQRIMIKGRKNLADKFGIPDNVPDTPAVEPSGQEINDILAKYGVK